MNRLDSFIVNCPSFESFRQRVSNLSNRDKGDVTERLAQIYLETAPVYRTALKKVWLLRQAPLGVLRAIGLPRNDRGIDLIAQHCDGTYWVIQAKYRTEEDAALGWEELSTFFGLSSAPRRHISLGLIVHTTARPISNRELMGDKVREIGLDQWKEADWSLICRTIRESAPARPEALAPRPQWKQDRVIAEAVKHFKKHPRGRLLMPCGTGKSLLAFWIAEALKAKTVIVAVPSLSLIRQSVAVWMRELVAKRRRPAWLCVASDDSVGGLDNDEFVDEAYDSGLPTTTDVKAISAWLRKPGEQKIIFTTYHSSKAVAEAAKLAAAEVDLVIFDEAHRTVGDRDREYAILVHDDAIKARRRLFMTATERVLRRKRGDDVDMSLSMDDDLQDYGQRFFSMTFKEAIGLGIISDYKIVTYSVTEKEVHELIKKNRLLNLGHNLEEAQARDVAANIAAKRVMKQYGTKHMLVFNRSIRAARDFCEVQDVLNYLGIGPSAANFHVNGAMSAGVRKQIVDEFKETVASPALMTNARCLTEGVDVPGIDCVMFAAPKQSIIDIVQATGRAMRKAKGKERGYIVIPIIVPKDQQLEEFAESTAFDKIVRIISALATQDTRIAEELKVIYCGPNRKPRKPRERIITVGGTTKIGFKISLKKLGDAITTRVWDNVARISVLPFPEAHAFVLSLGITSIAQWRAWPNRPANIPARPDWVYAGKGWVSWPHFLGTDNRNAGVDWLSFKEALAIVRPLKLQSGKQYQAWQRKHKPNIPANPDHIYAGKGWVNWSHFLGTDNRSPGAVWPSFKEVLATVRPLRLKNVEDYYAWRRKHKHNIPTAPHKVYAGKGWVSWPHFLGTDSPTPNTKWLSFKDARAIVRPLKLGGAVGYHAWHRKNKPNIPAHPNRVYAGKGWVSWSDFLDTDSRTGGVDWLSHKAARAIVRPLKLGGAVGYQAWHRKNKPKIPTAPHKVYAGKGWKGWSHFLGH